MLLLCQKSEQLFVDVHWKLTSCLPLSTLGPGLVAGSGPCVPLGTRDEVFSRPNSAANLANSRGERGHVTRCRPLIGGHWPSPLLPPQRDPVVHVPDVGQGAAGAGVTHLVVISC